MGDIRLFMSVEAYEVGQRSDKRGVNLISDALPFGQVYGEQTQSGFQSALIVQRLRGQGYGDFRGAVFTP